MTNRTSTHSHDISSSSESEAIIPSALAPQTRFSGVSEEGDAPKPSILSSNLTPNTSECDETPQTPLFPLDSGSSSEDEIDILGVVPTQPIDIPRDTIKFEDMSEERIQRTIESDYETIDELWDQFTKGFDASSFPEEARPWVYRVRPELFPGSYAHFLVMLLAECGTLDGFQGDMDEWLQARFITGSISSLNNVSALDMEYFIEELEVLRQLVAPLRGYSDNPIFWVKNRRALESTKVTRHLVSSMHIIEAWKEDVISALDVEDEDSKSQNVLLHREYVG